MHFEVNHPCIQHKLAILRAADTGHKQCRELVSEITQLVSYEALKTAKLQPVTIETPLASCDAQTLAEDIVVTPIIRAGIGMLDGILALVPNARVGFVGLYRDEVTKQPVEYYCKLPPNPESAFHLVIDPMLATGGSTNATIELLKQAGAKRIVVVAIVTCPEGLSAVSAQHEDVPVYVAAIDQRLDERKYIIPGLGDAGDRLYGTE